MTKIVYIGDVYCGWCHGFDPELAVFLEKHPEIEIEVLTGGLMVPPDLHPASTYKERLLPIYEKIATVYPGTDFSGKIRVMQEGTRIMDSTHPGCVLQLVKQYAKNHEVFKFFTAIQHRFFVEGVDLALADSYLPVIESLGLVDKISKADIEAALKDSNLPQADYKKAMGFGVQTFPTLAVERDGKWDVFPADGLHVADLEKRIFLN